MTTDSMSITEIRDVRGAEELFTALETEGWVCRGHQLAYGTLTPSIDRGRLAYLGRHEKLRLERQSIALFRTTATSLGPGEEFSLKDDIAALMVLRHYGVPTRLLDWSLSPFVAAYFSCCGNDDADGELWAVSQDEYHAKVINRLVQDTMFIRRYVVRATVKAELRRWLQVNHLIWRGSLFPDSAGAAEAVKLEVFGAGS